MKRALALAAAVLLGIGMGSASRAAAGVDLGRTEAWILTVGQVDGRPLRRLRDEPRRTTCYFWKESVSCVRD